MIGLPKGKPAGASGDDKTLWTGHELRQIRLEKITEAMTPRMASTSKPCNRLRPDSGLSLLRRLMSGFLGGILLTGGKPPPHKNDQECADDFGSNFNHSWLFAELIHDDHVGNEHAAGDPAQQARTEGHDQRIAVDELEHQGAAPDDDGHADDQAEGDQANLEIGRASCRDRVCKYV